jgi:3-oxoacyl-[acyl-carrier-protein] synthase II
MVTDPEPEGKILARCALEAIRDAGLSPDDIDSVHVHGTGTLKNEPAETHAMKLIFGNRYSDIPIFSLKGQIGHLIGACGAMEMLGVIHSIQTQKIMPTVNFEHPDPEAHLRVISKKPLEMKINNVLKLNAAFGGQNTAIVMRNYEHCHNRR